MTGAAPLVLHGSAVAVGGKGLLIRGRSGSGKSSLALGLMALGAALVSDDRVIVSETDSGLVMSAPPTIAGLIEARGVGILRAEASGPVPLTAVVDLDETETDRLPPHRTTEILRQKLPLLHNSASPYFAAALLHYLKGGRKD